MEYNKLTQQAVFADYCVNYAEAVIESDIVLPDFCPDIERIVKCSVKPRICKKIADNTKIEIRGNAFLRLCYISSEGKLENFETALPFSKTVEAKKQDSIVFAYCECDYTNCRAVSRRRFDLRCSIRLTIHESGKKQFEYISDIQNAQTKNLSTPFCQPIASACEEATLSESYPISQEICSVIKTNATVKIAEKKVISGKARIKASVCAEIYYIGENERTECKSIEIPVNRVIPLPGAEEGDDLSVCINIMNFSCLQTKEELEINCELEVSCEAERQSTLSAVCDGFLTDFESKQESREITLCKKHKSITKEHTVTLVPDGFEGEVGEIFGELKSGAKISESGEIIFEGEILLLCLIKTENEYLVREKAYPVRLSVCADEDFFGAECITFATISSEKLSSGKAEIKILCSCEVRKEITLQILSDFEAITQSPKAKDGTAAYIYFAQKGEDIFDIAKRYGANCSSIMLQNALDAPILEKDKRLLIPIA